MTLLVPFRTEPESLPVTSTTYNPSDKAASITLSGGDLTASISGSSGTGNVFTIYSASTGKYYWETLINSADAGDTWYHGVAISTEATSTNGRASSNFWLIQSQGIVYNGTAGSTYTGYSAGDRVMVAVDLSNTSIWFGRNGTWFNSGDPGAGTGAIYTNVSGTVECVLGWSSGGPKNWNITSNFGGSAFTYTVPSGFNEGWGTPA